MPNASASDFEMQLASHYGYLLRFARMQLRNDSWAEDAVSETTLAALSKPQAFQSKSQLKTWLVGILKHKVIDQLRSRSREVSMDASDGSDGSEELDALMFKSDGHFTNQPSDWGNPEQDLRSQQFLKILEACADALPASLGRIFLMREWLELSTEEICKEMNLSATNLYVQLHRARLRLRECLELNWFGNRIAP